MSPSDFSLVLAFGFISSLHCVQMCGPIVLTYSVAANTGAARRSRLGLHLAYNSGRTLTYILLGAVAGLAGGTMAFVGRLAGFENIAAIVAGIAMIAAGLTLFGLAPGIKAWRGFAMPSRLLRPAGKLLSSTSVRSKFLLGLLMGFLPCGLVYAALMKAMGEATPLNGALTLLAFGMGTSVALIVVGLGSSAATQKLARWGTTVSAITVLVMGALLIARGAMAGPAHCSMHHMSSM
ncbi:MAG: sulfite exporter TauE/SafE family protein [Terracidiphilus sp.]|jgi:sulfite exporter TauE/SafE